MMESSGLMTSRYNSSIPVSIFDTVFNYLNDNRVTIDTRRAVYHRLQSEISDENLVNMKKRLVEFSALKAGWDGYGEAIPISNVAIRNTKQVLDNCRPSYLTEWRLFPNVNGTILLEVDNAAISIGDESFTYWFEADGKDYGEEYVKFSVSGVVNAIKKINSYV
jgi:hypothetical protein